jgi:hypothetical protein
LHTYIYYLQVDWVHWLHLAEFTYNNSVHASTGVMPFFAEMGFHPSIEATVQAIPADGSVHNVLDAKVRAEKLVELWAALELYWTKVTVTPKKYADRCTRLCEVEVSDMVLLSGKLFKRRVQAKSSTVGSTDPILS